MEFRVFFMLEEFNKVSKQLSRLDIELATLDCFVKITSIPKLELFVAIKLKKPFVPSTRYQSFQSAEHVS